MHSEDASDARMRRHYVLVMLFEAIVVAGLWAFGRLYI